MQMYSELVHNISKTWQIAKYDSTQLPLLDSSIPIWSLTIFYLVFVLKWGQEYMKHRAPYDLKSVILVYNAAQTVVNFLIFSYCFTFLFYYRAYNFGCFSCLPPEHPLKSIELGISYAYYLNKIMDYLDTFFFVFRKSFRQISFLHVYHHVLMTTFCHYYMHYLGSGGQTFSVILLNTLVHTIMYSYYFLSAYRPKWNFWWKKYITTLQLIQFTLFFIHHLFPLFFVPECYFPKPVIWFILSQTILLVVLFINFYRKTYMKSSNAQITKKDK